MKNILIILLFPFIVISQNLNSQEIQEFLDYHNKYRTDLSLPNLKWSKKLASKSLKWGKKIRRNNCQSIKGTFHSDDEINGENIAWNSKYLESPAGIVELWASEKKFFVYRDYPSCCKDICGHYTQIIWKDTQEVGCAVVSCGEDQVWICKYYPAGNYVGEKPY